MKYFISSKYRVVSPMVLTTRNPSERMFLTSGNGMAENASVTLTDIFPGSGFPLALFTSTSNFISARLGYSFLSVLTITDTSLFRGSVLR